MSRIFGPVRQNGYVVRDIDAAMRHWVETLGVGPWFYIDRVQCDYFRYRGEASPVEMSIALANSGDLQITWATKAASAVNRAASPTFRPKRTPVPWSRFPTSAAARDGSSNVSAGLPPTGTAANPFDPSELTPSRRKRDARRNAEPRRPLPG